MKDGYYVMDPEKAVEMVDENTICVAAILGSTLNGEFEDVKRLNDLLLEKNKQTGYELSFTKLQNMFKLIGNCLKICDEIVLNHVCVCIWQLEYTNSCGCSKWWLYCTIPLPRP